MSVSSGMAGNIISIPCTISKRYCFIFNSLLIIYFFFLSLRKVIYLVERQSCGADDNSALPHVWWCTVVHTCAHTCFLSNKDIW